jgi:3-oxoacyl-[acyl-carrier protein] reductase
MADCILITGASRGIGLATSKRLAQAGKQVIGLARRPPEQGFPGDFVTLDLGDERATGEALTELSQRFRVDGVVNNVGLNVLEPVGQIDLDSFRRVIDVNLRTTIQVTQAFLPSMKARGYGRIVNISSRGALGRPLRSSYGAAKAGVVGMTRTWALELAPLGITANVVSPGPTATEMFTKNNLIGDGAEERRREFLRGVPMSRFAEPDEIAAAIAFFLSRDASFVTGQLLHACGGSSIGASAM